MNLNNIENKFNFKKIEYPNGQIQLRFYENPIYLGSFENKNSPCSCPHIEKDISSESRHEKVVRDSLRRTLDTLQMLSRSNEWEWFLTFTFNKEKVDRFDYIACMKKLTKWLNNLKSRHAPDLQYLIVPEPHKSNAWHFHGLFKGLPETCLSIAFNHDRNSIFFKNPLRISYPNGDFIYNINHYHLGWATATKIKDTYRASNYILKYITKNVIIETKNQRRFLCSKNLQRPKITNNIISPTEWENIVLSQQYANKKVTYHKEWKVTNDGYENYIHLLELS